ncbi:excalibur calcium-binding domain-containing protein [Mycolicibacterium sp. XJ647]
MKSRSTSSRSFGVKMFRAFFAAGLLAAAVAVGFAPGAGAEPYANCSAAAEDGAYNIPSDSDFYGPHLDRDDDGVGCER